jgi:gliding motility-associated-like protein
MKENKDIEQLMQEAFKQETATPPSDAWKKIQSRLTETSSQQDSRQSVAHLRNVRIITIVVAIAVMGSAIALFLSKHSDRQDAPSADATTTPLQSVNTTTTVANDVTANDEQSSATIRQPVSSVMKSDNRANIASGNAVTASPVATVKPQSEANNTSPVVADSRQTATSSNSAVEKSTPVAKCDSKGSTTKEAETASYTPAKVTAINTEIPQPQKKIAIPNIVTPNGDGINDYWVIHGLDNVEDVQVEIFTAHGKRVFFSDNYHGEFGGQDLPAGNYFYQVIAKSANVNRRGVLVIKK